MAEVFVAFRKSAKIKTAYKLLEKGVPILNGNVFPAESELLYISVSCQSEHTV